jgi:hypothetical protein
MSDAATIAAARLGLAFAPSRPQEKQMPKDELDNAPDPLAEEDDVVDEADEDDEFEDDEDEEDEDLEEDTEVEARGSLTREVGDEGGSPGEDMEISRDVSGNTRGSEGSETMPGGLRGRVVERRDEDDVLIKRAP